jgi:phage baseplate assembly protein gpV
MNTYDSIEIGLVVATYPAGNSVDVLLDRDGSRLSNVQVAVPMGSDICGVLDLPDIGGPADDSRWNITASRTRYIRAIVQFYRGMPIVTNFLLPQVCQVTFDEKNRRIDRHASDVYTSIDDLGNYELAFPNGSYLRIGTSPAHEDLTARDFDKKWAITRNTSNSLYFHYTHKNGGFAVTTVEIDPSGNIKLFGEGNLTATINGNVTATVGGNVHATVSGTMTADVTGAVTINAPAGTTINGPLTVNGLLTYTQGMAGSGGGGNTATINGNVTVTGGDVTADGKSLKTHKHGGVTTGGGQTGVPV